MRRSIECAWDGHVGRDDGVAKFWACTPGGRTGDPDLTINLQNIGQFRALCDVMAKFYEAGHKQAVSSCLYQIRKLASEAGQYE